LTPPSAPADAAVGDGIVVVDKPAGWTSHDVVARVRRLAHTRRVGHAGTLDPMATGVLVVGVNRATRLLGHLALTEKAYEATIRLGESTVTDDAEGEVLATADARRVTDAAITAGVADLTGDFDQVPSSVSAVKVDGRRSYARVSRGEEVTLEPRRVTVTSFDVVASRRGDSVIDLDVVVVCSTGTYIRALARDLGAALGVGGHLTALRRTRVGPFGLSQSHTLDELAAGLILIPLGDVARRSFPTCTLSAEQASGVRFGRVLPGLVLPDAGPVAVFDPNGAFLALYHQRGPDARPLSVFT
jgi:tRNA pseudouridine55 synthase